MLFFAKLRPRGASRSFVSLGVLGMSLFAANSLAVAQAVPTVIQTPGLLAPSVFRSDDGRTALAIQLTNGGLEPRGKFDFQAPVGIFSGNITLPAPAPAVASQDVSLQGDATNARFRATPQAHNDPATIRFQGRVNPFIHRAVVQIRANGQAYELVTTPADPVQALGAAKVLLTQVQNAPTSKETASQLYGSLSSSLQNAITHDAFVARRASVSVPRVVSASGVGSGTVSYDLTGIAHFSQPLNLTVRLADGSIQAMNTTMYLALENGSWRFLSTTALQH